MDNLAKVQEQRHIQGILYSTPIPFCTKLLYWAFSVPPFMINGWYIFFAKFVDKYRNMKYNKNNSLQIINNGF